MKAICFTLLVGSIPLIVQSSNGNTPIGARSASMGNASVSISDVWSAHNNQAGLGFVHDISSGFNYENRFLLKVLSVKSGVLAIPVKGGTFGLCITNFGYSIYNENKYSLSFAKAFGDKLSAGIAMDCLATRIAEGYGNKNVLVAEIGLQSKPLKGLTIGVHIFNPNRAQLANYNNERISTIFRLGAGYDFSDKVSLVIETEKGISQRALFKAGLEYKTFEEFYLRAGISTNPAFSSFGVGLNLQNFKIDLSANYHQTLGICPQVSLMYTMKKSGNMVSVN